jgi:Spy/CpxP family protein refolding chaperone
MLTFRAAALALTLLGGSAVAAAAQQAATPPTPDAAPKYGRVRERMGGRLFRGITLTADQKASIKQIHDRYRDQFRSLRESARPAMQEARAARQRGDTAAAKAAWQKTAATREQLRSLRQREMADVRGVLTAEQQKQFDQNVAQMETRAREHRGRRGERGRHLPLRGRDDRVRRG